MTSSGHRSTHRINARTYFALVYSVSPSDEIVAQIQRHHDRLRMIGTPHFDRTFARHVSYRLRRDQIAAGRVRDAILNPDTSDYLAAVFVSLLRNAIGLDDELLAEIETSYLSADRSQIGNGGARSSCWRQPASARSFGGCC